MTTNSLQKVYNIGKTGFAALSGVTISIEKGDFIAIVGPSGSGKSTLLNLFGALDRPTQGQITIDGNDISKMSDDDLADVRNAEIGFIFQNFYLLSYMSALENVEVPMMAAGIPITKRRERAKALLGMVGLQGLEKRKPSELSGGQQQRVAIARALANSPKIIMADEPTGNLDSKSSSEIIEILRHLCREETVTILMVTHNMVLVKYCNRILYVKDGEIEKEVNQIVEE
ncbi:MAG: ABC transporter ATP-binding protein [Candidatus Methanomethylicus sp.]|nr:ABC transporter ATP-binding protein [Candidatus Methanomethylicus sp.]